MVVSSLDVAEQVHLAEQLLNASLHLFALVTKLFQFLRRALGLLFGGRQFLLPAGELFHRFFVLELGAGKLLLQRLVLRSQGREEFQHPFDALFQTGQDIGAFFYDFNAHSGLQMPIEKRQIHWRRCLFLTVKTEIRSLTVAAPKNTSGVTYCTCA